MDMDNILSHVMHVSFPRHVLTAPPAAFLAVLPLQALLALLAVAALAAQASQRATHLKRRL